MVSNLKQGRNVILADEMGLGKTIQCALFGSTRQLFSIKSSDLEGEKNCRCLAVLEFMRRTKVKGNAPFLLIAPLTTIPHWRREIETWTEMNVVPFVGSQEDKCERILMPVYFFLPFFVMIKTAFCPLPPTLAVHVASPFSFVLVQGDTEAVRHVPQRHAYDEVQYPPDKLRARQEASCPRRFLFCACNLLGGGV